MDPTPALTLIAAVSQDGFISAGTGVPWDLPRDKAHFREVTRGQWLLIGRRTYLEMLGWFGDHHPLVLTRDETFAPPFGHTVRSIAEALLAAQKGGARELFVCGGGAAYAAAMPLATRLILTHVDTRLGAGVPFPVIGGEWASIARDAHPADPDHPFAMVIAIYERRVPAVAPSATFSKK